MVTMRRPPLPDGPGDSKDGNELGPGQLLLTAKQSAAICGKSLRTWRSWDSAGLIPQPVRIGRSTLWRLDELRRWIAAGCPHRDEWEARR